MGGVPPLGYDCRDKKLVINETEAVIVRHLFALCLKHRNVRLLKLEADRLGLQPNPDGQTMDGPAGTIRRSRFIKILAAV